MAPTHSYEPRRGHRLAHDPLNSIIAPRPIGWISTIGPDGTRNIAPYSFFNLFNYKPPIIGFTSTGWKDTVANIEESGEFVWNLATVPLLKVMNETSAEVPSDVDEFALGGLTPEPSTLVAPPRVAESPVSFECRVTKLFRHTNATGQAVDAWMVLGEAVMVHLDETLIVDAVYDTVAANPLTRGGGPVDYFWIDEEHKLKMRRPDKSHDDI